jgi:hypothetical protein
MSYKDIKSFEQESKEKDADIERLKNFIDSMGTAMQSVIDEQKQIITELADALDITTQFLFLTDLPNEIVDNKFRENKLLQQRAREAS